MKMSVNVKKVLIAIGFLLIFLVSFVGGVFAQKVIMPQGEVLIWPISFQALLNGFPA